MGDLLARQPPLHKWERANHVTFNANNKCLCFLLSILTENENFKVVDIEFDPKTFNAVLLGDMCPRGVLAVPHSD